VQFFVIRRFKIAQQEWFRAWFWTLVRPRPGKLFFYKTRARHNWCQGPVPVRGPAVENHWLRVSTSIELNTRIVATNGWWLYGGRAFLLLPGEYDWARGILFCAASEITFVSDGKWIVYQRGQLHHFQSYSVSLFLLGLFYPALSIHRIYSFEREDDSEKWWIGKDVKGWIF
jgi:hypothetical protein